MTAEALKGDRERCLAIGMDDYVSKPIAPTEMYRAIERFPAVCLAADAGLQKSEPPAETRAANAEQHGLAGVLPSQNVTLQAAGGELPAVDWNVAKDRLGGGGEVLSEFSELLKTQAPMLLADLRRAIETRDVTLLRRSAHTLKSSASYFGAKPLVQVTQALENLDRAKSFDNSTDLLVTLELRSNTKSPASWRRWRLALQNSPLDRNENLPFLRPTMNHSADLAFFDLGANLDAVSATAGKCFTSDSMTDLAWPCSTRCRC
jgi:HPt (histidine-containing phosphotransfer) domain-containing protein